MPDEVERLLETQRIYARYEAKQKPLSFRQLQEKCAHYSTMKIKEMTLYHSGANPEEERAQRERRQETLDDLSGFIYVQGYIEKLEQDGMTNFTEALVEKIFRHAHLCENNPHLTPYTVVERAAHGKQDLFSKQTEHERIAKKNVPEGHQR